MLDFNVWDLSTCKEHVKSDKIQDEKFLLTMALEPTASRFVARFRSTDQARNQEFSSGGGGNFTENYDKQKTGCCGGSFHSVEVWFKSTFQTIIYIQVYFV